MKLKIVFVFLTFLLCSLGTGLTFAQDLKISAVVIDSKSEDPLTGANVFLPKSTIGTTTDKEGYFLLTIPEKYFTDSLVINYLGYEELRIPVRHIPDRKVFKLNPLILDSEKAITVYADKLDLARKELPHFAHVLNVEEIERYGTSEISDLFKSDPSIRIEGNDLDGRFIQIRGSDANEVNVYVDGILLNSLGYNNAADISVISPDNIEKLEVLKGSNLVLLGSGAFGGVVNITTRKKAEQEYTLKLKYGSFLSRLIAANLNIPLNKHLFIYYFGNLGTFSPEIEYFPSERFDEKTQTSSIKTIRQNHHLSLNYFTETGQYSAKVMGYLLDYDKPGWVNLRKNISVAGLYKGEISSLKDFDINLNYLYGDDEVNRESPGYADFLSLFKTQRLNIRLAKNFSTKPDAFPTYGFQFLTEYFHDEVFTKSELQDQTRKSTLYDASLYDNRASLGGVISIGDKIDSLSQISWKLYGGIRGEFLASNKNYKISTYGFQINIKKANWTLSPYLNYGENIKFPTLLDNAYLIDIHDVSIINNSLDPVRLQPELAKSREFGMDFQYNPSSSFYRNIEVQVAYFNNEVFNKLMKRPLENTVIETQLGQSTIRGYEALLKWNNIYSDWTIVAGYGSFDVSNQLVYAYKPDEKYSLQIDYHQPGGFYILALLYHEGKSTAWDYDDQNQYVIAEVPSFYDMDISVGYEFAMSKLTMKIFAAGYNVFDNAGYKFYNLKKRFLQIGFGIKY